MTPTKILLLLLMIILSEVMLIGTVSLLVFVKRLEDGNGLAGIKRPLIPLLALLFIVIALVFAIKTYFESS